MKKIWTTIWHCLWNLNIFLNNFWRKSNIFRWNYWENLKNNNRFLLTKFQHFCQKVWRKSDMFQIMKKLLGNLWHFILSNLHISWWNSKENSMSSKEILKAIWRELLDFRWMFNSSGWNSKEDLPVLN